MSGRVNTRSHAGCTASPTCWRCPGRRRGVVIGERGPGRPRRSRGARSAASGDGNVWGGEEKEVVGDGSGTSITWSGEGGRGMDPPWRDSRGHRPTGARRPPSRDQAARRSGGRRRCAGRQTGGEEERERRGAGAVRGGPRGTREGRGGRGRGEDEGGARIDQTRRGRQRKGWGGFDFVLVSGDLSRTGETDELDRAKRLLDEITKRLARDGKAPFVLTVPGRHDALRFESWDAWWMREVTALPDDDTRDGAKGRGAR